MAKGRAKILKSKVLYTGKVFRLLRDTVIEPGGVRAQRDIIVHPGSVVVLPIFAAEGLVEGAAQPEEDERITPRIFTLKQVDAMIRSGRLRDAKSIAGLLYYMRYVVRAHR